MLTVLGLQITTGGISAAQTFKRQTILIQGPKLWNSLPSSLTSLCSLKSFKSKLIDLLEKQPRLCVKRLSSSCN